MGLQHSHCHGLRAGGSRCQKECRHCAQLGALRLYRCHRCGRVTLVCGRCDHGQRYCAGECRHNARKESLQRAGRRYQQSVIGKRKHAARMAQHRRTQQQKVTHQGTPAVSYTHLQTIRHWTLKRQIDGSVIGGQAQPPIDLSLIHI